MKIINTLTYLESLGLVNRLRGRREHLFILNRQNFIVQNSITPLYKNEDEFETAIKEEIKLQKHLDRFRNWISNLS